MGTLYGLVIGEIVLERVSRQHNVYAVQFESAVLHGPQRIHLRQVSPAVVGIRHAVPSRQLVQAVVGVGVAVLLCQVSRCRIICIGLAERVQSMYVLR